MQVVFQNPLHNGPIGPLLIIRLSAMLRFFLVQRKEQIKRDDEEVPGPNGGVENLQVAD